MAQDVAEVDDDSGADDGADAEVRHAASNKSEQPSSGTAVRCVICFEQIKQSSVVPLDGCPHLFHAECLLTHFRKNDTAACQLRRGLDPAAAPAEETEQEMLRRAGVTDDDNDDGAAAQRRFHELLAVLPEPASPAARAATPVDSSATPPAASGELIDLVSSSSDDDGDDDGDDNEYRAGDNLTCMNDLCAYQLQNGGKRKRSRPSASPPIGGFRCVCGSAMAPPRRRLAKRRRGDAKPAAR